MLNDKVTVVTGLARSTYRACVLASARGFRLGLARSALAAAVASLLPLYAAAQVGQGTPPAPEAEVANTVRDFDLPAGSLAATLEAFSTQSGIRLDSDPGLLADRQARAVSGRMDWRQALGELLQDSGLEYRQTGDTTVVIATAGAGAASVDGPARARSETSTPQAAATDMEVVTVTGTRIRGGTNPSPVITIGSENIREEGFTDLGEVIRSLPQNFSGGQNPGIVAGAAGGGVANQNITGGSGLNLRGLGQDASLTLLNGRRMSYGGFSQMVDIGAIPVEAVDRIEIVADGSSAIYGSDAVGGVGNVILKRDFEGVAVGARYGQATDGGLSTREYTASAGTTWSTGGLIATFKKSSSDPIYSDQRDYTEGMYDPSTLYQDNDLRSGLLSAHQSLGGSLELRLDALRTTRRILTDTAYGTIYERYTHETTTSLISPSLDFSLPNDWTLTVGGVWGKDETDLNFTLVTVATGASTLVQGCYCNESRSYEIGAEGPLFAVGGGEARIAVGAGYRQNHFLRSTNNNITLDGDGESRFAYAEINLPLIGPSQGISGVNRLAVTGAMRAEDYDSFGGVTTPRIGLVYGPSADFTLKASWGKSFKAPTLSQQRSNQNAYLYPATRLGGTGYPADATVLYLAGGNPDLNPERARTWSTSLAFHPEALPGLEAELTWFNIDYTSRVIQPIVLGQALSNPLYAEFITYSPTAAEQAEILANYPFTNASGAAYDPNSVVAFVPNLYINISQQLVKGLDLSGSYRFDLGTGRLTIRGSTSWLDSRWKVTSAQSAYDLAGILFYPAKINSRVGAIWNHSGFTASLFGNYRSGVTNRADGKKGASFTTFDSTLRYDTGSRNDALSGLAFELSALNLFNRAPPLYTPSSLTNAPYDSTNYSAIGRYLSLSVSKHW